MNTTLILDRGMHTPAGALEWILWIGLLGVIAAAIARVAGIPTAILGAVAGVASYGVDKHLFIPATIAGVALLALVSGRRVMPARTGLRVAREGLYMGAGFLLYEEGRAHVVGDNATAERNAGHILSLEHRLH
jgi:hypothetical protein